MVPRSDPGVSPPPNFLNEITYLVWIWNLNTIFHFWAVRSIEHLTYLGNDFSKFFQEKGLDDLDKQLLIELPLFHINTAYVL